VRSQAVLLGATESVTKLRCLRNCREIYYYCERNCVSVSVNTYRYCEKLARLLFDFGVIPEALSVQPIIIVSNVPQGWWVKPQHSFTKFYPE